METEQVDPKIISLLEKLVDTNLDIQKKRADEDDVEPQPDYFAFCEGVSAGDVLLAGECGSDLKEKVRESTRNYSTSVPLPIRSFQSPNENSHRFHFKKGLECYFNLVKENIEDIYRRYNKHGKASFGARLVNCIVAGNLKPPEIPKQNRDYVTGYSMGVEFVIRDLFSDRLPPEMQPAHDDIIQSIQTAEELGSSVGEDKLVGGYQAGIADFMRIVKGIYFRE